jgi:photosystem II stability/assembly factor-like uncharacterized protein
MNFCLIRVSKIASLTLVFLSLAATSMAAGPRWTQATPFGGSTVALGQSPSAPQTVYVATGTGELFASADGGATWRRRVGLVVGSEMADMFVDSQDPLTVYAQTKSFLLFRTRDGSLSWSQIGPELEAVLALVPDREAPHVLYAGTASGLYRSPDGGDTWSLVAFDGSRVLSVAVDPGDSATLSAALGAPEGAGAPIFWKSSDHGETWVELSPLPAEIGINTPRFSFDPARPATLYLFPAFPSSSESPAFRSTDGGLTWALLPAAIGARDLLALPNGLLLAATDFGIARSADGGDTWSPPLPTSVTNQGLPRDAIVRIYTDGAAPGALFALGSVGVWRSGDSGTTWLSSNQGLQALPVISLAAAPTGPDTVFAVAGTGIFSSADQGDTWTRVHSDYSGAQPLTIEAIDTRDPQTIYGFAVDGIADTVLASTDGGHTWAELPIPYFCSGGSLCSVTLSSLILDPGNPETLFVSGSFFFHFQGAGDFLLRSDDGGHTWQNLRAVHNLKNLALAPGRKGALYGTTCSGLFKSDNRGVTWRKTGRGLPKPVCGGRALVIDPQNPQRIYAGTAGQGVFVSADGGATFRAMNKGLETAQIATLLIDPSDPAKLYAAVPLRGVFRWKAGLRTWVPLNAGLPVASFNGVLALDPQDPSILYAGTRDQGIFRLDLDE